MYASAYGYGPGSSSSSSSSTAAAAATPQPFNPNGGPLPPPAPPSQPHHPHQHQHQHQHQHHQHSMYNSSQQYAAAPGPGPGPGPGMPPSSFSGQPGPSLPGNPPSMGMAPNHGMAHVAGGQMPAYQTPYSSSPYGGGGLPASTAPNLPPNFLPPSSGAPPFPMGSMSMNPPNQAQRMQPPPSASTPTQPGPRASPFTAPLHNTPPNAGPPSQFATPQAANQGHAQAVHSSQQAQAGTILTPQTPNFPPGAQAIVGGSSHVTPLSPGSESREKERVTLLLSINQQLLMEVIHQQLAHAEARKDDPPTVSSPDGAEKSEQERADEKAGGEKGRPTTREYVECMRRLQSNLAYLAAIADRSHKPSSQIPPHPAILVAPGLNPKPVAGAGAAAADSAAGNEEMGEQASADESRGALLREQYKQLQALFPGVEVKKEAPIQAGNPALRAQAQPHGAAHAQQPGHATDPLSQQRMQNEMLRQKMMHHQAQQNAQHHLGLGQQQQGRVPSR
ncbi:hypothetical protein B2J93_8903 [Marssonina coronariae]|uniref:Glutamine repeat protein-1 n=1 Tax=Diplocarpon coronariae TaxID=2795749 RepID=A0A218YSJ3_9HELO|nr:hypothetical protein B2J93_8903 [Marssonina coronariae]